MPTLDPLPAAVGLTVLAGLATMVGGVLAVMGRPPGAPRLALGLGLAGGVMLTLSLLEILPEAAAGLTPTLGAWTPVVLGAGVLAGVGALRLIERLLPEPDPAQAGTASSCGPDAAAGRLRTADRRMLRLGTVTAVGIGLHNLPEGVATFAGTLSDPTVGLTLAVAMAIHNIPEGLAVAVPVRQATGSRAKALGATALTGLAEPLGAALGYLVLAPVLSEAVLAAVLAVVAGVMAAISLGSLLPAARNIGGVRPMLTGAATGAAVMALTLTLLH